MNIQDITAIITNIGFPIAVCLICFWYINKQTEAHKQETQALTEAVNNNNSLLQRLLDRMGSEHDV